MVQPCAVERPCQLSSSVFSGESFAGLGCSAMNLRSVSEVPGRSQGSVAMESPEVGRWPSLDGERFNRSSVSPKEMLSPGERGQQTYAEGEKASCSLSQHHCHTEQGHLEWNKGIMPSSDICFYLTCISDVLGNGPRTVGKSCRPSMANTNRSSPRQIDTGQVQATGVHLADFLLS